MNENEATSEIIGAAIEVHRALGPGLLERVYEECLAVELMIRGLTLERQKPLPIVYKGRRVGSDLKIDLLVADSVVVEVKSVGELLPVHAAQLLTYLRLTDCRVGLLINFNVPTLRSGLNRVVNNFHPSAPPRLRVESPPLSP